MLKDNLKTVLDNIEKNKTASCVTVLCATKTVPSEIINTLPSYGLSVVGENKVQELLDKYHLVKGVEWRIIGRLQTNKVKYIIDKVSLIESVDRQSLADEIDKQAKKHGIKMKVLVQINGGDEENKGGVAVEDLKPLLDYVKAKENVELVGVMSVFPKFASEELYAKVQRAYEKYKDEYGLTVLSMGMSEDYATAVKYGSTEVRLGSALFGKRYYEEVKNEQH